jgi:pimeloyl-ACP methyl ester carboxylesterase
MIPALAERYQVLVPDLRGFGWSEAPDGDYAKSTFARDMLGLLDTEGIERVRIIGHDWGGYTAFLLALEHPDRVERLLALDVPPPWAGPLRPQVLAAPLLGSYQVLLATPAGRASLRSGPWLVRSLIRAGSRSYAWTDEELDVYASVLRDPARARATSACYRTFLTRELPAVARHGDRSHELRVPSRLLMGQSSAIRWVLQPPATTNLAVATIRGAGHFLPEEAPEELLEVAFTWLAE